LAFDFGNAVSQIGRPLPPPAKPAHRLAHGIGRNETDLERHLADRVSLCKVF